MTEPTDDVWISVNRMDSALAPFTRGYAVAVPGPFNSYCSAAELRVEFNLTAYIRHVIAEQSVSSASDL